MFMPLTQKALSMSIRAHILFAIAAFAAFRGTNIVLDGMYARSGHPVDFATGQLAFDGATIFGYYETMREAGTMGIYVQTQLFDFAFIASVMMFGILFGTLLGRIGADGTWTRRLGLTVATVAVMGATMDACENMMSFLLMQFGTIIPQTLAFAYSSFAAAKFLLLTLAMAFAAITLIAGLLGWMKRKMFAKAIA